MKKILFAAGLLTLSFSTSFGQEATQVSPAQRTAGTSQMSRLDPKKMAAMRANRLEQELSLTPDQKTQVESILSNVVITPDNRQTIEKETQQKIRAILTPEQNAKYDEMIKKRAELKQEQIGVVKPQ